MPWSKKSAEQVEWRRSYIQNQTSTGCVLALARPFKTRDRWSVKIRLQAEYDLPAQFYSLLDVFILDTMEHPSSLIEFVSSLTVIEAYSTTKSELLTALASKDSVIATHIIVTGQSADYRLSLSLLPMLGEGFFLHLDVVQIASEGLGLPYLSEALPAAADMVSALRDGTGAHVAAFALEITGVPINPFVCRLLQRAIGQFSPSALIAQVSSSAVIIVTGDLTHSDAMDAETSRLARCVNDALSGVRCQYKVTIGTSTTMSAGADAQDLVDQAIAALIAALQADTSRAAYEPGDSSVSSLDALIGRLSMALERNVLPFRIRQSGHLAKADVHWLDAEYGLININVARGVIEAFFKSKISALLNANIRSIVANLPDGVVVHVSSWLFTLSDLTSLRKSPSIAIIDGDSDGGKLPLPLLFRQNFK